MVAKSAQKVGRSPKEGQREPKEHPRVAKWAQDELYMAARGVEQSPEQADVAKEIDKHRCQISKSKPLKHVRKT